MKQIKFILAGVLFGIVLTKAEVISWYRIQEMFSFQSFHMYGVIGTAVTLGIISVFLIKKFNIKDFYGQAIIFTLKEKGIARYLFGGIIFGLGWALSGSCPGPMFINIGNGYPAFLLVIFGAVLGTYFYGIVKDKLPH